MSKPSGQTRKLHDDDDDDDDVDYVRIILYRKTVESDQAFRDQEKSRKKSIRELNLARICI